MKKTISYLSFSILLLFALLLNSCRTINIGFKPNYENKFYRNSYLKRLNTKVVKVYDNRPNIGQYGSKYLGYVLTGATNKKTPYLITEPLADYIQKFVNLTLDSSSFANKYVPITMTIDTFRIYETYDSYKETGYINCSMFFSFPVSQDSFNVIHTYTTKEISSKSDVTELIDIIIYDAVLSCTEKFINEYDSSNKFLVEPDTDLDKYTKKVETPKDLKVDSDNTLDSMKKYLRSITLNYLTGNLIKSGYNFSIFSKEYEEEQQFFHGLGYGFHFLNLENIEKNYKGGLYGLMSYYEIKYFTFKSLQGPYLSGNLSFLYGTESIMNKYSLFFGILLKESIGLMLGPILVEAGLFQVFVIGSELLPQDIGYSLGIGLQF
ncbi:MAG: hypothetical protein EPN82_04115 [Bacteroidetes bacterium]|nr:MAG: hypothetical protein EPN82_04115 [Bacteroidota bacterium]